MKNPHRRETRSSWADLLKNKQSKSPSGDSTQNQIMKNPQRRSSWADLLLDIQAIILAKLNLDDIIRFRAVCKNWHIPKDRIINSKHQLNLPWICKLSWLGRLQCQIYNPHSRQIINTWKSALNIRYTNRHAFDKSREYGSKQGCLIAGKRRSKSKFRYNYYSIDKITEYGSKQGWLIAGTRHSMFMYNPYIMEFISLPHFEYSPRLATFSGNPVLNQAVHQVFVYCTNTNGGFYASYIYSYCLNGDNLWSLGVTFAKNTPIRGLEYVNGKIFCLFGNGITEIYGVEDRSWTLLNRVEGSFKSVGFDTFSLWLTKGEGDLLMAVVCVCDKCWTFYFDWSNTIWVQSDLPGSTAIFIGGGTGLQATLVRPFVDCDDHDATDGCNLYFFSGYHTMEPPNYSFEEMRHSFNIYSDAVFFIEPPFRH